MDRNLSLIARAHEGDREAENELCRENMGLVQSIAARFCGRGSEMCDLVQIGAIGLIKAIAGFDLSRGLKFSTYAVPMIAGEIKRYLRDDGLIRVSRGLKERRRAALSAEEELRRKLGREPSVSEVADVCKMTVGELMEAYEACAPIESMDIPGEDSVCAAEKIGTTAEEDSTVDRIMTRQLLSALEERERKVLVMRYFDEKTQSEIAASIGVSQVHVSRIERAALLKLRSMAAY